MSVFVRQKDRAHVITGSADTPKVYAHLTLMPLAANISANPHLLRLAEEAVDSANLEGPVVRLEHDMGRSIGHSELVATSDADNIFFARQTKTAGFTRFVKNRKSDPTQFLSLLLARDDDGDYELTNIWIGKISPPMPDAPEAIEKSGEYWARHAVIYNGQPIVSSTLTKTCPY
jgi:hypothetical protein